MRGVQKLFNDFKCARSALGVCAWCAWCFVSHCICFALGCARSALGVPPIPPIAPLAVALWKAHLGRKGKSVLAYVQLFRLYATKLPFRPPPFRAHHGTLTARGNSMGYFTRAKPQRGIQDEQAITDWLSTHRPMPCPPGTALGLSWAERETGLVATDRSTWAERVRRQQSNEVAARKNLQFEKLSGS